MVFSAPLGIFYRFADVGKMIENTMLRHLTGSSCFINNGFEVLPLLIGAQVLKVAGKPGLNAIFRLPSVGFKVVGEGLDDFGFHVFVLVLSADGRR